MKSILHNLNILNMLLLAVAILLFFLLDYPLIGRDSIVFKPPVKAPDTVIPREDKASSVSSIDYLDYGVVAEKNLFHPERKIPIKINDEKPQARPEIILYGTFISSDKKSAYIDDKKMPYSTPGRGKRQLTIDEGSMISGFKLSEVHEDSILLTRGDEKIVIRLRDQKNRDHGSSRAETKATPAGIAETTPAANQTNPFQERKTGAATFQTQQAGQSPLQVRPKTTIPQRRESAPRRRPNALDYN